MDWYNNGVQAPRKSAISKLREQQLLEMQAIKQKYEQNQLSCITGRPTERNPMQADAERIMELMRKISRTIPGGEEITLEDEDGVSLAHEDGVSLAVYSS
jgi:hypothetical protein